MDGAKEMVYGALIIGVASTVLVIMESSSILDTVIYNLSLLLEGYSTMLSGIGMFIVQTVLEFLFLLEVPKRLFLCQLWLHLRMY